MQERERGRLRRNEPRTGLRTGSDEYEDQTQGSGTSMTSRSANTPERQEEEWSDRESGGGWSGYVVPYRYYGPGYRGVGYYSVMYQGAGENQGAGEYQGVGEGEQFESESRSNQPVARYAQGSGWNARAEAFARQSGRGFAGRGPKGYRRSDERLRDEVSDRLMADDQIDASDIEVDVRDGEVTLTGIVHDRWAKRRAEDCAEQVMGVRDVMNQIRVKGGSGESSGGDRATSGTTSRSGSRVGSASSKQTDTGSGQSAQATGANGRRRATSSSR